jgi:hypothetical protein
MLLDGMLSNALGLHFSMKTRTERSTANYKIRCGKEWVFFRIYSRGEILSSYLNDLDRKNPAHPTPSL